MDIYLMPSGAHAHALPPCGAGDAVRAGALPGKVFGIYLRVQQRPRARPGQHPLHPSGEWSVSHTACTPARLCGQLTGPVHACVCVCVRESVMSKLPLKCVTSVLTLSPPPSHASNRNRRRPGGFPSAPDSCFRPRAQRGFYSDHCPTLSAGRCTEIKSFRPAMVAPLRRRLYLRARSGRMSRGRCISELKKRFFFPPVQLMQK